MERWLNAALWSLRTSYDTVLLVGENCLWSIQYFTATVKSGIFAVSTFTYESVTVFYSAIVNSCVSLCNGIAGGLTFILCYFWSIVYLPFDFTYNSIFSMQLNPVYQQLHFLVMNYSLTSSILALCLATVMLSLCFSFFLQQYFHRSAGRIIQIDFNDINDVMEVSDDERDDLRGHAAHGFDFAANVSEDDTDAEDTDNESHMTVSTDETSDNTDVGSDSDDGHSDTETIDIQLPDPQTPSGSGHQHGYSTRSKGTADHLQRSLDQERERSLCVICQDQVKSVLVLPCRHMCMCVDCARTVVSGAHGQRRICPLCRGNIRIIMNVYA